jgi:hypothetical protein
VGGRWTVTAKKGNLAGFVSNIDVPLSAVGEVGDIVVRAGGTVPSAGGMTDAEAEQRNRQQAELKKLFDEANAALAANAYADALTKLNEAVTKVETCSVCYIRIGDVHSKQGDAAQAETAYKKAIETRSAGRRSRVCATDDSWCGSRPRRWIAPLMTRSSSSSRGRSACPRAPLSWSRARRRVRRRWRYITSASHRSAIGS